jgi:hypothetical protein
MAIYKSVEIWKISSIFPWNTFDSTQLVHFTNIRKMRLSDISFITVSTAEVTVMIPR